MASPEINLLHKSREMFMRSGVKSMTMDDIARELGMSKKTIYQFVGNKAELVNKVLNEYLSEERKQVETILSKSANAVDGMINMVEYLLNVLHDFNPASLNDLQKYYPEAWKIYDEYRYQYVVTRIRENLDTGVKQGVYRADMDADIIARIYVRGIDMILDQQMFPQKRYSFFNLYKEFLKYHLRGIVSPKGLKILEQHSVFKKQL
ncbi:MAG: TetR/AcrR family transcriptional regulator [Chitinophagales bacterium]|nr:TetR/AcrR family transcriptional regulator [Chitinophagales bacterium]